VAEANARIAGLEAQRQLAQTTLDATDPTVPMSTKDRFASPAMQAAWELATLKLLTLSAALGNIKPANENYAGLVKRRAELRGQIAVLEQTAGDDSATQPNPVYQATKARITELDSELLVERITQKSLQMRLAEKRVRVDALAGIFVEYGTLDRKLRGLETREAALSVEYAAKERAMALISIEQPTEVLLAAEPPPRPTEPNPYLLALIGCVVGLAFAIALIFLIDFLQMTFKSIVDVETGLGLPVLGNMSYLETEQELFQGRNRRARLTLFAVLFLALLLTVVTIYYIAPSNLPQSVTELFDFVLGARK
jgi:uncharacterized protein involved in exopolysaccharide biosynthesis